MLLYIQNLRNYLILLRLNNIRWKLNSHVSKLTLLNF